MGDDSVGLIVATSLGTSLLGLLYLFCIATVFVFPSVFYPYPYEVFGMFFNGFIGVAGYALYAGNIPISGGVNTVDAILAAENCAVVDCIEARQYLIDYQVLSTFRFVCWYVEFFVSYIYIAFFLRFRRCMTLLRYGIHSVNVILSFVTLLIVSNSRFPKRLILGSKDFAPVVTQGLILVWVVMSYWFIAQSRLYRIPCISSKLAYVISTPFGHIRHEMSRRVPLWGG